MGSRTFLRCSSILVGATLTALFVSSTISCGGEHVQPQTSKAPATSAQTGVPTTGSPSSGALPYPIVGSGQTLCYDASTRIEPPAPGAAFYGQDAQQDSNAPSYSLSDDSLTVIDNVTGLMWQQTPDTNGDGAINVADKMTHEEAVAYPATLNAARFAGYDDWRLPTIKELYSLILFIGTDPNPMAPSSAGEVPFIDTEYFTFAYGDMAAGERIIDSQYASSTKYVFTTMNGNPTLFGVNFADGRIKGYGLTGPGGGAKKFVVLCARGNPDYGKNDFVDNGDGTVTDRATGLMWAQADSGEGLDWQEALAWAQQMNAENYLGHDDWRMPSVKELQSLIDYTRSPDTTDSAAIDPLFSCTGITNEAGQADFPCYWTSTTHVGSGGRADTADYMAFGRAMGYMVPGAPPTGPEAVGTGAPPAGGAAAGGPPPNTAVEGGTWMDVHGAGAQRSDPKVGDPADFPYGRGPQGDAIRIYNYVRLVRDAM
jgi:hypothetical protein